MMAATKSVAIRLGTEGKAEIKNDFADVRKAGEDAFAGVAAAAEQSADQTSAAADRATERQKAAWVKLAAAGIAANRASASQNAFNQQLGVNGPRATDNGAGFSALAAQAKAEEDATNAALKLRAALDPLWAAQQRYDDEIRSHNSLLAQGAISEDLHRRAVAESEKVLKEAGGTMGLNRTQTMIAQSAVMRFTDSILAGQSPVRAFALEAHKLGEVLSFDDGGVAGGLTKLRALINPVTLAIGGTAAVVALGTLAWVDYSNAVNKLTALSQGSGAVIGATGAALEANAEAAAHAGNISVSSARDIETGYVKMGGIGADVLTGLTAMTRNFAAATGQDAAGAQHELGTAFQDPVKGAEELAIRYGAVTQAQIEHIRQLVDQNDLYGAQKALLQDIQPQFDKAAEHANILARAWHFIATEASDAWTSMGKALDRLAGGGDIATQIENLTKRKHDAIMQSGGFADTSGIDAQIVGLQAQLRQEQQKANGRLAVSRGTDAMKTVDAATGGDALTGLQTKLASINGLLADNGKAAGLTADQIARARTAQDEYTHAVQTYLPEGEKQARIAALDAQIAAAKSPADKDALTTQKARIENGGKLITSGQAEADALAKGAAARATASKAGDTHAATLAREAASVDANITATLALAAAYLTSSAAGQEAEARRKAITTATKAGADVEAAVARQIALDAATAVANAAKSIATMNDETAARNALLAQVAAGTLNADNMNDALKAESLLRPLLTAQANEHGDALRITTDAIEAQTKALAASQKAIADWSAAQAVAGLDRNIAMTKLGAAFAGDTSGARELAQARLAATQKADTDHMSGDARTSFLSKSEEDAQAKLAAARADYFANTLRSQQDSNELSQAELDLAGANADARDKILARLKLEQQIKENGKGLSEDQVRQIIAAGDAQSDLNAAIVKTQAAMAGLRDIGNQVADDVFNPSNWTSWGDVGKRVIADIENAFIKLALLNPLKNLINGNSALPTLSSAIGSIGKLFGGGVSPTSASYDNVTFTAAGSEYFSGGMTWVAENGPELINLPRGSKVTPASDTRRMLAANDGGAVHNHFHLTGAVMTQDLLDQMNAIGDGAAVRGAMGGSATAQAEIARRGARRLGR